MNDDVQDITCEDVLKHLLEYLDGEVTDGKKAEIDKHLHTCRGCFSRAEFESALKARVKKAGHEPVPEKLQRRIADLIDEF